MKEVIYLVCSQDKVESLRKTLPEIRRGQIPVKLTVTIDKKAFMPPVVEKEIYVNDWRDGVDLDDVEFRKNIITQDEADLIKQRRLEKMTSILEKQGYVVTPPDKKQEE